MMKNKFNTFAAIAFLITTFVFGTCDSGTGGGGGANGGDTSGGGSLTITVGSSNNRAVIDGIDTEKLTHKITVTDSSRAVQSITINPPGGTANFSSLALGTCTILVEGFLNDNKVSEGKASKNIVAGSNGTVPIQMIVTVEGGDGNANLSGNITISPNTGVYIGTELTATYTGAEAVSFQWKKDGSNVGANSNKYTPTAAGSYTVTVSATGFDPKTSAAVDVNDPSLLTLSGTITITPNANVFTGTQLTANYSGAETVSYQWKKDGDNVGTNSTYTPTTAGSYTVTVSATGYNSKTSAAVDVAAPEYTVIFNSNDGNSPIQQPVKEGGKATKPADPTKAYTPTTPGLYEGTPDAYTFDGWYNGNGKYNFETPVTGNITLTAQWTAPAAVSGVTDVSAAIKHVNDNSGTYTLLINEDVEIGSETLIDGELTIIGLNTMSNIKHNNGYQPIFDINGASLILGDKITLTSSSSNFEAAVLISGGGSLTMKTGSIITDIKATGAGYGGKLVMVTEDSTFTMEGGTITNNPLGQYGSVVYVESGSFNMSGGTISGNLALYAVFIESGATYNKTGGNIEGKVEHNL